MKRFVTSYVNPDTDGVCTAIVYGFLKHCTEGDAVTPVIFGSINSETAFVLARCGVEPPQKVTQVPLDGEIVLVDTHHKAQLPSGFPFSNVVEIIDHHPQGDSSAFPKARIQNEAVGAAATLITEKWKSVAIPRDKGMCSLLASAIVSNTLNFTAPSTTERDRAAFSWLREDCDVNEDFIAKMFEARSDLLSKTTSEILTGDYKEFSFSGVRVGISQLETTRPEDVSALPDLRTCLDALRLSKGIDYLFLNLVDITNRMSVIIAVDDGTQEILRTALGAKFKGISAGFPRILLRKTDLIPPLQAVFSKE